jgi:hypothetical protein
VLAPLFAPADEPPRFGLGSIPPFLIESTTQFAVRWSTLSGLLFGAAAGPESIVALAQGVGLAMLFQTIRVAALATVLTIGFIGTFVVAQQQTGKNKPANEARSATKPVRTTADVTQPLNQVPRRIDLDRKTEQILRRLDEQIDLKLPKAVTLDQVLKAIKQATTDANFPGIPIYVDPIGLQEVNATIDMDVDVWPNGSLGYLLQQALHPLRLSYVVKDGFLMISSRAEITDHRLDAMDRKLDRLLKGLERLERSSTANTTESPKL